MSRDPREDPRPGDVLLMRWGTTGVIKKRTDHMVWVQYSNQDYIHRYGVPLAWTTELSVGAVVVILADEASK